MGDMMLVNSKNILLKAKKGKYAVPQFNINNLEWTKYILEASNELNSPVILGVSEGAIKYIGGYNTVVNIVIGLIQDLSINIPIILHLDHGTSVDSCIKAIDAGFTSVMIDASKYELNENIKITKEVVDYAHKRNVSVEAEVGHIGGVEDNVNSEIKYATKEDCLLLYHNTLIDSIAPALGSVHGIYKGEPNLQFDTMQEINEILDIPLVLHGGTGIDDEKILKSIECGIAKININTELQIAWSNAVRNFIIKEEKIYDPRKIISSGEQAIKKTVREKLQLLRTKN